MVAISCYSCFNMAEETKVKSVDPVGQRIYGEKFFRFHKLAEITDLIAAFKDFYYAAKVKDPNETLTNIAQGFNSEVCAPVGRTFYPSMSQLRVWRVKWDRDLIEQMTDKSLQIIEKKKVYQVIKTRNDENKVILGAPQDNELEAGVRTLGGELLNDAMQILKEDQELEEIYTSEELMKRRSYVVNVFSHATRLVHGKAALLLKASEEKRNTAGFLMSLLAKATAGKMSDEEMNLLKTAYVPKTNESQPA